MDDEQTKLDEELAHVIRESTQSRISTPEALVLVKTLEEAGWRISKIEVKAEVDPYPPTPPTPPPVKPAYKAPETPIYKAQPPLGAVSPSTWQDPRTATDGPAFHQALKSEVTHSEKTNARVEGDDITE